jgi:hypothetical protein
VLIGGATAARLLRAYGMRSAASLAGESKIRLAGTFGTALAVAARVSIL